MRTLLCCIGRKENQYIREFVEYYKNLGFTNIMLYDNNYDGEEYFDDVIGDYIDSGYVILKNYRNQNTCQLKAYEECYAENFNKYDWIAFFDCDEFLTFTKCKTIDEYLSMDKFKDYNAIKINWMCYGDGGLIGNDGRPLLERIKTPVQPFDKHIGYDFPENDHIKSIVRCLNVPLRFMGNPHVTNMKKQCNNCGMEANKNISPFNKFNYDDAYLRHYSTKTVSEYCNKMIKGFPDRKWDINKEGKFLIETRFFRYNDVTPEKVEVIKKILGIDMSYLLKPVSEEKESSDNSKVKIFLLCYEKKDYEFPQDSVIKPLQCGAELSDEDVCELKDNTGTNISKANYFYVENTGIFWIWKNVDADYLGNMSYRRMLHGISEDTNFDEIFSKYDIICAKPYNYPSNIDYIPAKTVMGGYAFSHCLEDLKDLGYVISKLYPTYMEDWEKYIVNGENLYYSSGFVMSKENYEKYCVFLFNCLVNWLKYNNIKNKDDLLIHVARDIALGKYLRFKKDEVGRVSTKTHLWLEHIGGFLGERLFTLWLLHNFPKEKIYEVEYDKIENTRI